MRFYDIYFKSSQNTSMLPQLPVPFQECIAVVLRFRISAYYNFHAL